MRTRRGQSTIELIGGLMVVVPIVLLGVDVATMFFGSSLNANVCRDAARIAASGPPAQSPLQGQLASSDQPKMRALQLIRRSQNTQGAIRLRTGDNDVIVTQNISSMPDPSFGGMINGTVTVQTTSDVYPPFLLARVLGRRSFSVSTTQTFPFTYVVPPTFALNPGTNPNGPLGHPLNPVGVSIGPPTAPANTSTTNSFAPTAGSGSGTASGGNYLPGAGGSNNGPGTRGAGISI